MTRAFVIALALLMPALPALAEVPGWLSGEWRTNARLTAPDGAQLRIRCTLDAGAASGEVWTGTLGCATVQGRFEGTWQITLAGSAAAGNVVFSGSESADLAVSGTADAARLDLRSDDGQGVAFAPGSNGDLVVEMRALGPQRLTGSLNFEVR